MDKCGKCKHKISTNENIMLSICEIYNNENIVNKYAMTAKCAKCGAVLQKSIPQWWATEMVQIAILLFWFLSVKMMENLYIIKILIAAIEAVLLYLLYKFCISTIYAVIPWREAAHSTEEALHEKMLRYNLICRTLTVIFICFLYANCFVSIFGDGRWCTYTERSRLSRCRMGQIQKACKSHRQRNDVAWPKIWGKLR